MHTSRTFDIVLFGATGFTGALTAQYLADATGNDIRWALAGRNRDKLEAVRDGLSCHGGARPELLIADADQPESLAQLAASTRVVITTVGPYALYGEPLVAACAKAGTDYVDLTGEPAFVTAMRDRYHAQAIANGAKIVHACGFDSIPHDLGVLYTIRALERRVPDGTLAPLNVRIEGFVSGKGGVSGGTWQSALLIMREYSPLSAPFSVALPGRRVRQRRGRVSFRREFGSWAFPIPTIDPEIVCQSAALNDRYGRKFSYAHYLLVRNFATVVGTAAALGAALGLAKTPWVRDWLRTLRPAGTGPSAEERSRSSFSVTFLGRAGDRRARCRVSGGDPGYGETSKMLAESALCLVQDRARLPQQYGVITSSSAFGDVLIERLTRVGIVFEELAPEAGASA